MSLYCSFLIYALTPVSLESLSLSQWFVSSWALRIILQNSSHSRSSFQLLRRFKPSPQLITHALCRGRKHTGVARSLSAPAAAGCLPPGSAVLSRAGPISPPRVSIHMGEQNGVRWHVCPCCQGVPPSPAIWCATSASDTHFRSPSSAPSASKPSPWRARWPHIKTHTGIKAFKCQYCMKSFSTSGASRCTSACTQVRGRRGAGARASWVSRGRVTPVGWTASHGSPREPGGRKRECHVAPS